MTQWTALHRWKMYSLEFDYANMDNVWSGLSSTLFLSSPTPWPPGIQTPTCQPVSHSGYFFFSKFTCLAMVPVDVETWIESILKTNLRENQNSIKN